MIGLLIDLCIVLILVGIALLGFAIYAGLSILPVLIDFVLTYLAVKWLLHMLRANR